ncbi:MAG: hypothetical protein HZA88_03040 [Verrucomicrobia bacterium]|nr:hypothetical protein [Verrucomicrobiota bacterium]
MSEMNSNKCSGTPIVSLSVAVLAILVAVLAWLFSGFIKQQNENLTTNIVATRQQAEASSQQLNNLIQLLGQYLQQTRDPNVVMIMNRRGLNVQLQQPQAGAQQPAQPATGAPATPRPAATGATTQPAQPRR